MFPERKPVQTEDNCFTIYRGQKAICAIQLVAHCYPGKWRYILKADETLNVQLRNKQNEIIISKNFTGADVDEQTKQVSVIFSEEETATLNEDKYYLSAYRNGFVVLTSQPVIIKEMVQ